MPPPTSRRSTTSTRSTATSSHSRSRSRGWRAFRRARGARRSPDDRPADLAPGSRRGRAPARGARALAGVAREARLRPQRAAVLRAAAEPAARLERPLRRDDEGLLDPHQGRARDDRRRRPGGDQRRALEADNRVNAPHAEGDVRRTHFGQAYESGRLAGLPARSDPSWLNLPSHYTSTPRRADMAKLTDKQKQLLLDKNIGSLATLTVDGSPQVTPVWVDWDGEYVLVNTLRSRAKSRQIEGDPGVERAVVRSENRQ